MKMSIAAGADLDNNYALQAVEQVSRAELIQLLLVKGVDADRKGFRYCTIASLARR